MAAWRWFVSIAGPRETHDYRDCNPLVTLQHIPTHARKLAMPHTTTCNTAPRDTAIQSASTTRWWIGCLVIFPFSLSILDLKGGDDARGVLLEPVDRCGYRGPVRGVERGVDLVEVGRMAPCRSAGSQRSTRARRRSEKVVPGGPAVAAVDAVGIGRDPELESACRGWPWPTRRTPSRS